MALSTSKCNYVTPLSFKGLTHRTQWRRLHGARATRASLPPPIFGPWCSCNISAPSIIHIF